MKKGGRCAALLMSGMFRVLRSSRVISPYRRVKKGIYMEEHGTKNNKIIFYTNGRTRWRRASLFHYPHFVRAYKENDLYTSAPGRTPLGQQMRGIIGPRQRTMMLNPATRLPFSDG